VSAGEDLLDRLRRTTAGYSQADFDAGLQDLGYEFIREVRHGRMYRHALLASHPDVDVRRRLAHVVIPKGRELKQYVGREVLESVTVLMDYRAQQENDA